MPHTKHEDTSETEQSAHMSDGFEVPDEKRFRGFVRAEDIADLEKRDQKTILAMSILEQWSDWHTETLIELNRRVVRLEYEAHQQKRENAKLKESQKEHGWAITLAKWFGVTLGAGALSGLIRLWLEKKP